MVRDKDRKMATAPRSKTVRRVDYPTSDGKPMAETELHWQVMVDVVEPMRDYFAADPMVHVGGNLLLFYEEGNRRKHISPDAFMVRGIPKFPLRDYYLLWEEGKPPDVVIEITSKTTRREDQTKKRVLYRDVLKIPEYFQFDPTEDYLDPSLQGVRRIGDDYVTIVAVNGRLPSDVLGLHLERSGQELKLWDPARGSWLLSPRERAEQERERAEQERQRAEQERQRAEAAEQQAAMERQTAEAAQRRLEEEIQRLRKENEAIRRRLDGPEER
jgi:Uma2 family endonuclease